MQGIPQGPQHTVGSQKPTLSWQTPAPAPKKAADKPLPLSDNGQGGGTKQTKTSTPEEKSNIANYVGVFIAGVIVGILLGWAITSSRSGTATPAPSNSQTATTSSQTGVQASVNSVVPGTIVVGNTQPAGASVAVSSVNVTKPTWVVVYDNNNGVPGRALGARLFLPTASGGETSAHIQLLRRTVAGTTYLVGQIVDDGDYNLSFSKDSAVLDTSGKPVLMVLSAQ